MMELKPLVAIVGPTAVGKSQVAVQVAKALATEVLAADSRQVYRGMDIGTDKPSMAEREGVPHRLIDLVAPDERFNVGMYRTLALAEIDRLHREHRLPLVVGGTGLYVRALVRGLWEGPPADWALRDRLLELARVEGTGSLHRELERVDPDLASRLHPRDTVKIIRGLEVYRLTGRPLSEAHRRHAFGDRVFAPLVIGLMRDRDILYRRIEERVDLQLARGLLAETERLLRRGYGPHLASMKGLGYRHMAGYVSATYSYDEGVRRFKRDTRHFAKRQLTWFRREPHIIWLQIDRRDATGQLVQRILDVVEDYLVRLRCPQEEQAVPIEDMGRFPAAG